MNNVIKKVLFSTVLFICTPLMSVDNNQIQLNMSLETSSDAEIDEPVDDYSTQAFRAAESGNFEELEKLVLLGQQQSIDFKNVRNSYGDSLLHAIMKGLQEEANQETMSQAINIIQQLAELGLDVNIRNSAWQTPVQKLNMIQSPSTQLSLVQIFHELGAKFDIPDSTGTTVLAYLLRDFSPERSNTNSQSVKFLVKQNYMTLYTKLPRMGDNIIETHTLTHHFIERAKQHLAGKADHSAMLKALYHSSEVREALMQKNCFLQDEIETLQQKKGFPVLLSKLNASF